MASATRLWVAFVALAVGSLTYVAFRPRYLVFFDWFDALGLSSIVDALRSLVSTVSPPDWFVFCLPNGLWTFALVSIVRFVWHKDESASSARAWLALCGLVSFAPELGQSIGVVPGVFDALDLGFLIAGFSAALLWSPSGGAFWSSVRA